MRKNKDILKLALPLLAIVLVVVVVFLYNNKSNFQVEYTGDCSSIRNVDERRRCCRETGRLFVDDDYPGENTWERGCLDALAADAMRSAGPGRDSVWNIKSRGGREGDCNGGPEIVFADSHCYRRGESDCQLGFTTGEHRGGFYATLDQCKQRCIDQTRTVRDRQRNGAPPGHECHGIKY